MEPFKPFRGYLEISFEVPSIVAAWFSRELKLELIEQQPSSSGKPLHQRAIEVKERYMDVAFYKSQKEFIYATIKDEAVSIRTRALLLSAVANFVTVALGAQRGAIDARDVRPMVVSAVELLDLADLFFPWEIIQAYPYTVTAPDADQLLYALLNCVQYFFRVGEIVAATFTIPRQHPEFSNSNELDRADKYLRQLFWLFQRVYHKAEYFDFPVFNNFKLAFDGYLQGGGIQYTFDGTLAKLESFKGLKDLADNEIDTSGGQLLIESKFVLNKLAQLVAPPDVEKLTRFVYALLHTLDLTFFKRLNDGKFNQIPLSEFVEVTETLATLLHYFKVTVDEYQEDFGPFFSVTRSMSGRCSICTQKAKSKCSGCSIARYCSPNCQKTAWKNHKGVCGKKSEVDIKKEFIASRTWYKVLNYLEAKYGHGRK